MVLANSAALARLALQWCQKLDHGNRARPKEAREPNRETRGTNAGTGRYQDRALRTRLRPPEQENQTEEQEEQMEDRCVIRTVR